jgi:LCP family protein required for cell wall assembly
MRHLVYRIFLLGMLAALGGVAAYGLRPWYDAAAVVSSQTGQHLAMVPTVSATPSRKAARPIGTPALSPTPTVPPFVSPRGRVNYLLLGSDTDLKVHAGTWPDTQTIIFVSYDTTRRQIYMVSIPRDLYVPIAGFGTSNKIDTAPEYGGLADEVQTVESNFHVTVDHYGWIGLRGFVNIVDVLGGVDIDVAHPMTENNFPDDLDPQAPQYAIMRFFIPSGPQHLDGVTALEYVRARHSDLIEDIARSQRQQQLLLALKQKLKAADVGTFPDIIQDLKGQFTTDLDVPDFLGLADSALGIGSGSIHRFALDVSRGFVAEGKSALDGDILVPQWPKINALFACVMSVRALSGCANQ